MAEDKEGTVDGKGEDEMLPERGNPFSFDEGTPRDLTPEELADLYPVGRERTTLADYSDSEASSDSTTNIQETRPMVIGPPEDRGHGAVGPTPAEELFEDEVDIGDEFIEDPEIPMPGFDVSEVEDEVQFSTMTLPSPVEDLPPVSGRESLAPDHALVNRLVPDSRLDNLWERADDLRNRVYSDVDNLQLAKQLLDQIETARNQMMSSRANYEEAERVLNGVEFRIHHIGKVRQWSQTTGRGLLLYELVWGLAIVVGMMFLPSAVESFVTANMLNVSAFLASDVATGVMTMLWGGLGGVVGALVALRVHISRDQDFDRQWSMWYVTNPIMGIVMGAFVFLIVRAGLFALAPSSGGQIQSTWLIFVLAWLAGFQQNVAYDLIERVVRVFSPDNSDRSTPDSG